MSKLSLVFVCVGVLAVNVGALSDEERNAIRTSTLPLLLECSKEHNVKEEELKTAKESLSTTGLNPCFLYCFLQKAGIMDSTGLFDLEATKEKIKNFIKNEEDFNKFINVGNICLAVNDKTVSGTNKGCERAKLLLDCFLENKGDFTPFTS